LADGPGEEQGATVSPIKIVFWLSLLVVFYTYAGYPLLLWLLSCFKRLEAPGSEATPSVSVVMSAFNEEGAIQGRIENLISQDYPADKIEIIVVSDGSTDKTCDMVRSLLRDNVKLVVLGERHGKASALNQGIARAKGEIIVFADARQRFKVDAVSHLAASFGDPHVGCVSGELVFLRDDDSTINAEMGAYWRYEKWIRKMESRTGSVIGATGAIYAMRRELYRALPPSTILDDVLTPLNVVLQGFRCTFNRCAVAYDAVSKDAGQEWLRKVRTLAGNWQLLSLQPALFLPWRNPCWWRFVSHKILRLLVPYALGLLLVSSALLPEGFYRAMTALQLLVYAMSCVGAVVPAARSFRIVNVSYFFLVMNFAAVSGFWRWVTGRCVTVWQPAAAHGKNG
jgi:cellulose synthase/poly-beta-1,6-N-acetylglucosamine synthase-like glycosyltransferase